MWIRVVALAVVLFASAGPALGQFTVQPMKLDLQVTPGKILPQSINIRNTDPDQAHTITLTVVDLTQNQDADWMVIEPNSEFDSSKLASLKDSIRLTSTEVTLDPHQSVPVDVLIKVPRGTRGFSCAAILATLGSVSTTGNLPVRLRFIVPVILQVMGRSLPHRVESFGLELKAIKAGQRGLGSSATTQLSMDIENKGGTFPRCRPVARIWSWSGGHWRVVTTTGFQDMRNDVGIIPGASVTLRTDLGKSLPAGKYKIAGELYVDGKRTRRISKIIDFAGDPDTQVLAVDRALDLDRSDIAVESLPGATRITTMKVQNGADATVNVQATVGLPRGLATKMIDSVRGIDMDCAPWIQLEPRKFTLNGEGDTQVIRIISKMPETPATCPNYYANIDFWSYYPDGQSAGRTRAQLAVTNLRSQGNFEPQASADSLSPYLLTGSKYQIAAQFSNLGLAHYSPIECKAAITELTSNIPRVSTLLKSDTRGYMLPGETRNFTGVLDLSALDPGNYRLSAALQYDEVLPRVQKQTAIRVTIEGGERVLETTGTQEDLPQILPIKW
jgi:hypothetical protein